MSNVYSNARSLAAETFLRQAAACVREGNDVSADQLVQKALQADSAMIDVYARLGGICRESRQWQRARFWMERDFVANRMSPEWQLRYAEVLLECGASEDALRMVEDAYASDASLCDGYARIGYVERRHHRVHKALLLMQKDVEAGRITPAWHIRFFRLLAENGELDAALSALDQFCGEHTMGNLDWQLGLSVCQLYAELDASGIAEEMMPRLCEAFPGNKCDLLLAFADIQHKRVLMDWMAEKGRVTSASVRQVAASRASCDVVEDWQGVADAYEGAALAGVDLGSCGYLWKMVRARLFMSSEQMRRGNLQAASKVMAANLQAIVPALGDDAADAIGHGLLAGARSGVASSPVGDMLCERSRTLSGNGLLALSDLVQWYGFFDLGYDFWEKSLQATYHIGESRAGLHSLQQAFRAAMVQADYERAMHYAALLPPVHAASAFDYLSLHGFNTKRPQSTILFDDSLWKYLEGKSVAVVGPAPTGALCGAEIDGYDVVIRTCYTGTLPGSVEEFGSRTDMSNYAILVSLQWEYEEDRPSYLRDLQHYTYSSVLSRARFLQEDGRSGKAHLVWPLPHFYHKHPNAIQRILHDVLQYPVGRIKVFKSNFFLSSKSYTDQYVRPDYDGKQSKGSSGPMLFRQTLLWNHDLLCQLAFVRNLWRAGIIDVDDACRQVLELTNEQYMERMEALHGG